jgi:cytochrome c553
MGRTGLLVLLFAVATSLPVARADDGAGADFFEKCVRPVLVENCLGCHGPSKAKSGLRVDSREALLAGGDGGPALRPGDPDGSRLIEVIRHDGDIAMPPKRRLADEEIAALREWVKAGAPWPDSTPKTQAARPAATPILTAEDRDYWAFRPLHLAAPPAVRNAAWASSPIDRFVLARLEAKGLHPVPPADKRALIRRVTFDLTGLPPMPAEIDAFLADDSAEAFAKVVDRLLASPAYGERWARHWLDIARYGEDQAHTFEARLYPYGYRYRDWVVNAFNDGMPFERFVTEQIAGDLLPDDIDGRDDRLAATGLFALGPVYYGRAVLDELDDRVDTLTRGFLGLTVACARCHDHKFDPISQRDYYALAGIFSSTVYKEYPQAPPEVVARYDEANAGVKRQIDAIAAFVKRESARWTEQAAGQAARYVVAAWTLANRRKAEPDLPTAEFARAEGLEAFAVDRRLKLLSPAEAARRPYLAQWHALVSAQDATLDLSREEKVKSEVARSAEALQAYLLASIRVRDSLKAQADAARTAGVKAGDKPLSLDPPAAGLIREIASADGVFALPKDRAEKALAAPVRAELKAMRAELDRLKKAVPPKYPVIHALADKAHTANLRVHLRGNPATLGDEAPRRFLAVLSAETAAPFARGSGRLELARAIASRDNPLAARVFVNRVWAAHFGRGLVATPSNFGRMGEPPSHPELLDWLAARFLDSGGSLKALHREILLSSTYRLSTRMDSQNHEIDPDNVLLWRANRRRLEVEAWRDAMLAASGQLDATLGGPSQDLAAPDNRRRTLYARISRHSLDGLLRLFDFPDPNLTSDKRPITTVPLQQLFVLNSPFMEQRAGALAARLAAAEGDDEARIRRAFVELYGRPATAREVRLGLDFLAEASAGGGPPAWHQYAQVLLGTNEFAYLD